MEPREGSSILDIGVGRVWRDGEVVVICIRPNSHFTQGDAVRGVQAIAELSGGKARPVVVDLGTAYSADFGSRQYFTSQEARAAISAFAFVVRSPVARMVASFFTRVVKLPYPAAIFSDEAAALDWARSRNG